MDITEKVTPKPSYRRTSDVEVEAVVSTIYELPSAEPGHESFSKDTWFRKTAKDRCESYRSPVAALLQMATFAATITFTIILTPRDGDQAAPGVAYIAYANALFCGCIMGCIMATIGIEICIGTINQEDQLDKARRLREEAKGLISLADSNLGQNIWDEETKVREMLSGQPLPRRAILSAGMWFHLIGVITGIVGFLQFAAFYLMLYASLLFLDLKGPFVLGSILYLGLGVLAMTSWPLSLWLGHQLNTEIRKYHAMENVLEALSNRRKRSMAPLGLT